MNSGFIVKPIEPEHFVFGDAKLGDEPINPSGDWTQWLPVPEDQNIGVEPMACTTFALLNCVETLLRKEYGTALNLSDRFLAYASGTTRQGNDPHTVAETLRKLGNVLEADYPYTPDINTWELFYTRPAKWLYTKALEFIAEYGFGHSWVYPVTPTSMMSALKYSPLTAGVYAWLQDPNTNYYINPQNLPPCHDVMVYGYVENNYWMIFDSYAQEVKKLAWDFPFVSVKRYTLNRQVVTEKESAWTDFLKWMTKIINALRYGSFGGVARSAHWSTVRDEFIKEHPECAVCGGTKKLNVHHIKPFHLHPELELQKMNLITLCNKSLHHLWFGHLGDFKSYNVDIEVDARIFRDKIKTRPFSFELYERTHK